MSEAKPLASLTGGLLARKGAAKPAMRRQAFAVHGNNATVVDDLGWDDMGYDVDPHTPENEQDGARPYPVSAPAPQLAPSVNETEAQSSESAPSIVEGSDVGPSVPEVIRQRELLAQKMRHKLPLSEAASQASAGEGASEQGESASGNSPQARPEQARAEQAHVRPEPKRPELISQFGLSSSSPQVSQSAGQRNVLPRQPVLVRTPRPVPTPRGKAAFTLRIDPERHLRLRLASAVTRRSAQVILIEALDKYLKTLPEIDALAHQVPQTK